MVLNCKYCNKKYKTEKTLYRHIDKFHSIELNNDSYNELNNDSYNE